VEKPSSGYDITERLVRLAVRIVDTYGTGGARRNAWRAMQADAQRAQDRAEVEHMLAALDRADRHCAGPRYEVNQRYPDTSVADRA